MSFYNVISNLNYVLSSFKFYPKISFIFKKILDVQQNFLMYISINEVMMFIFSLFRLFTADRSFLKVLVLFNHLKFKLKQSYEMKMLQITAKHYLDPYILNPTIPDFLKNIYKKIF